MDTALKLDPFFYEFENEAAALDYDHWFRTKVEEALNSTEPPIPHDEVVTKMRAKLAERTRNVG
ncbi:hypothetical protein [Stenoxybacter acetivorans]|uniref:type II toxin-antitoxin system RelB family antitoxin n=1 Tax=Stenoxybacter acetivorans TaxID=422441 RepID=UPI000561F51B|nr:hypothetical protein [Stenoxybacter acetivorans]